MLPDRRSDGFQAEKLGPTVGHLENPAVVDDTLTTPEVAVDPDGARVEVVHPLAAQLVRGQSRKAEDTCRIGPQHPLLYVGTRGRIGPQHPLLYVGTRVE